MPSGSVGCLRWTQVGGEMNHWMGLDDAVMIKDNHIAVIKGQEHCRQDTEPGGSVEAIARPD